MLIKVGNKGFSYASSMMRNVIMPKKTDEELEALCRSEGERKDRAHPEAKGIYVLSAQHDWGMAYLYVNESEGHILEETDSFQLEGLSVVG